MTVLSLLLAEAELLLDQGGIPPLLLLDDALSELDADPQADSQRASRRQRADPRDRDRCGGAPARSGSAAGRWLTGRRAGGLMERLDGSVRGALSSAGVPDAGVLAEVTRAWPDAVGPGIARAAWPQRLARDGTLHVTTASSTWAFELGRMEEELLAKLRPALGDETPPAIRFAPGPVPSPGQETVQPPARLDPTAEEAAEAARADRLGRGSGAPRGGQDGCRREPRCGPARPQCLIYFERPAKPPFCRHFLFRRLVTDTAYTGKDITVLEGLEPVRLRPGMYIGSTGFARASSPRLRARRQRRRRGASGPQRPPGGDDPPRRLGHGARHGPRDSRRHDGGPGLSRRSSSPSFTRAGSSAATATRSRAASTAWASRS